MLITDISLNGQKKSASVVHYLLISIPMWKGITPFTPTCYSEAISSSGRCVGQLLNRLIPTHKGINIIISLIVNMHNMVKRKEIIMTVEVAKQKVRKYIEDADKAISEDEEYIRGWKCAFLIALELLGKITE